MFHESDLLENEVERFSRQVIVPGIGIENQIKLRNTSVLVVGCGGLGCPVIMYLATCGIVKIGIVDHDKIEIHNLQRQVLFKEKDINKFKAEVAGDIIKQMNSNIDLNVNIMKVDDTMS
ncbi:Molybdenum cofactor synthesis protein 3 [Nosema bombycis CQ1]|uniref:Molybdenum cofactor synthesis protein 3 n=1 Tax=Nosema bombycis (strain CQ1 / CVCC 102059) TaxID=578461 RepID=R0M1L8_NOSB1|nr:Molybdenum cofactor synthesis protein 3 [Nosema bombycis CQ1]|eukprot:EOB11889.1 Molybdenum cofactor synthesis protein 3 [Nosema bombycis CQ1]